MQLQNKLKPVVPFPRDLAEYLTSELLDDPKVDNHDSLKREVLRALQQSLSLSIL